jgi:hypothetical protein
MVITKDETGRTVTTFADTIWYRRSMTGLTIPVYDDVGTLVIRHDSLEFEGKSIKLTIKNANDVFLKNLKLTAFDPNIWIVVKYLEDKDDATALFMDGAWLGNAAKTSGSRNIYNAIKTWLDLNQPTNLPKESKQ